MSSNLQKRLLSAVSSDTIGLSPTDILQEKQQGDPLTVSGSESRFTEFLTTYGDFVRAFVDEHCILDDKAFVSEVPSVLFTYACFEFIKFKCGADPRDPRSHSATSFPSNLLSFVLFSLYPQLIKKMRTRKKLIYIQGLTFKPDSEFLDILFSKPMPSRVHKSIDSWLRLQMIKGELSPLAKADPNV